MSRDVFISHASQDAGFAERVSTALEAEGRTCWLAPRDVLPGVEYAQAIVEAIDGARLVVLLLTVDACRSPHVSREIERAVSRSIPVVTFRFSGVELSQSLEYYLSQSHWLQADAARPELQLPPLLDAVSSWLEGGETASAAVEHSAQERSGSPRRWTIPALLFVVIAITSAAIYFAGGTISDAELSKPERMRIAVIPVADGVPQDRTFLITGVSEALSNHLSQIPTLSIIAGTSAASIAARGATPREIGDRLDVEHLVEVTLREDDRGSELTVKLVDTRSLVTELAVGIRLPDGDEETTLNAQILATARKLQSQLGIGLEELSVAIEEIDPRAFESYLKGLEARAVGMMDNSSRPRAMRNFKRATQIDPDFADAWAYLAWSHVSGFGTPLSRDFAAYARETEAVIARALALDARQPLANSAAVFWYSAARLDFERAGGHLDIALEEAPGSIYTQAALASFSALSGDSESALIAYEYILSIDPLNMAARNMAALYQGSLGLFEEAFEFLEACHLDRCLAEGFVFMAAATANFTRDETLRQTWGARLREFAAFIAGLSSAELPRSALLIGPLGVLWFEDPENAEARQAIRSLFEEELISEYLGLNGPTLATVLDEDTFFDTLEQALEAGHLFYGAGSMAPFHGTNPYPDWVLQHPRYHALWEQPKTAQLASMLRSRGLTAGLPRAAPAQ